MTSLMTVEHSDGHSLDHPWIIPGSSLDHPSLQVASVGSDFFYATFASDCPESCKISKEKKLVSLWTIILFCIQHRPSRLKGGLGRGLAVLG